MNEMSVPLDPTVRGLAEDDDWCDTVNLPMQPGAAREMFANTPSSSPERPASAHAPIAINSVLRDRYVLEKQLGSGGMGTVFMAFDRYRSDLPEAEQYVAIKILHDTIDDRAARLTNLKREFYCTQRLSHGNIIKVYELDRDRDVDFFTMELLEGELLSQLLARLRPLAVDRRRAWSIIRETGMGLAHAHARGVVHTDLKPQNIFITLTGEVRILDFGASGALATSTPAYASCELLAGRTADPSDDLYSLACLSYELLTGAHPFQRRPSTEARNLRIVPSRPPGLTRRQWQTLLAGLSWHRAARSLPVSAWLRHMNAERAAAMQVPLVHEVRPESGVKRPAFVRGACVMAALLMTVSVAVLYLRLGATSQAQAGAVAANAVGAPVAAAAQPPANAPPDIDALHSNAGAAAANVAPPSAASPVSPSAWTSSGSGNPSRTVPARSAGMMLTGSGAILPGENFAEIRVHRPWAWRRNASFVWWTEAASARPGVDYVSQAKVTQSFPLGGRSTSCFVKLLPRAARPQHELFYVVIAAAGKGSAPRVLAREPISLPAGSGSLGRPGSAPVRAPVTAGMN